MLEILDKIDSIVRDLDYHNVSKDHELYGGLTYNDLIKIGKFIQAQVDNNYDYFLNYVEEE